MATEGLRVKEEMDEFCGVSEAAARAGLYAGHAVNDELVLGPELLQPPDITFTRRESKVEPISTEALIAAEGASDECPGDRSQCSNRRVEQLTLNNRSVQLERMAFDNFKEQFHWKSELKAHQGITQETHNKPYSCDVCNKQFAYLHLLRNHKRIHTGEKPYTCDVCNKQFTQQGYLKNHKRIHKEDKPYSCDVCNKQFKRRDHLKVHKRIHTGEKPYSCNVCNKPFTKVDHLKSHKRIHTGKTSYSCVVCDKQFAYMHLLKIHKRIHTEKPYSCNVCNKLFTQLSNLKIHKRIHTGEKPYSCDVCNKRFTQLGNFQRHHKRIHAGENYTHEKFVINILPYWAL